jgi:pimeloyl-ACP methyl ester carboxylesterase
VSIPALYIAGDRDFVLTAHQQFIAKQSTLVPNLRPTITLPGCGHWTKLEPAPEVSASRSDGEVLQRRVGKDSEQEAILSQL